MIKVLDFQNFKSWKRARVECARITGIFGANSSGKTSILQFLLMLKQTKDGTDPAIALDLNGDLVSLGTFSDILPEHDEKLSIRWDLEFTLDKDLSIKDTSKISHEFISKGNNLTISSVNISQDGNPVPKSLAYGLGDAVFSIVESEKQLRRFDINYRNLDNTSGNFDFIRTQGRPWGLPGPIKSYAFPDQARTYFQNAGFLADLETAYEKEMNKIFYLGPIRQYPQRDYISTRSRPTAVGQRGENTIDAILSETRAEERGKRNLKSGAKYKSFEEMVAYWLREMGLLSNFRISEIAPKSNRWQVHIKTHERSSEVLLPDVGFGIPQVLPVITLLQYVPEGSTVVLEQPEIHLHPLAQAALADVLIQAATHRKIQIIFESHSEHLLLRLQRRIAENKVGGDIVRLYFCDARKGESKITELEVDSLGNLSDWPDKFMGDAFNEVASAEIARLNRRMGD